MSGLAVLRDCEEYGVVVLSGMVPNGSGVSCAYHTNVT